MFMFTEAPAEALDRAKAVTPGGARADRQCRHDPRPRPQADHVGSFYRVVIDRLEEVIATAGNAPRPLPDLTPWVPAMGKIMAEGEKGHFVFFKDLFMGVHAGFNGHPDIWSLNPTDRAYPPGKWRSRPAPMSVIPGRSRIRWP